MSRWWLSFSLLVGMVSFAPNPGLADPGIRIIVWKAERELWVLRGDKPLRRYPISLGLSPVGPKEALGDMKTPVGRYFIYEKRLNTKYRRFLALNYPELSDAERALQKGRISAGTWADIWYASKRRQKPPWDTPLGGFVGIHGTGGEGRQAILRRVFDWTEGCIALSDRDVEELYELVPVGTPVEIYEALADGARTMVPELTSAVGEVQ